MTATVRALRAFRPSERVTVDVRRPELFESNPHLEGGWEDDGTVVVLPLGGYAGQHMADSYAHACGIDHASPMYEQLQCREPQIFLTTAERATAKALDNPHGAVAVDAWAGWPSRRWPRASWERLVAALSDELVPVIEVGATVPDCNGGRRNSPLPQTDASYLDQLTIRETAAVLERCALYVGNDSGLMHVAAAVDCPQVIVFGAMPSAVRAYASTTAANPGDPCGCAEHCMAQPQCPLRVTVKSVLGTVLQRLS